MANTRSAVKRKKQSERRRLRNRAIRSKVRSAIKSARTAAEATPAEGAGDVATTVREAIRILDKAVSQGVVHPNTAARKKSSLARRLHAGR